MRKLMWFAAGFGLAALIGMYFLAEAWYFLAAGAAALLLAVALCLTAGLCRGLLLDVPL